MGGVNGIGSGSQNYYYSALSSGKKYQSAARGASELAILQDQERQVKGINAGTQNLQSGKNALNIADGATAEITENLQRMRELAIKASNDTLSDEDKSYIQSEIEGLKAGIGEIADRTNYNGVPLLDNEDGKVFQLASDANGTTQSFETVNATLESLGIAEFDVTGEFDIKSIDDALSKISRGRSSLGAQTNGFDASISFNNTVSYNTTSAMSSLGDTEYGDYIQKLKTRGILDNVTLMMQRRQMEDEERAKTGLFG